MVALALSDTRIRNYYDIWLLSQSFEFDENQFGRAILLLFICRDTSSPKGIPDDMTTAFGDDDAKQRQWDAFIRDVSHIPGLVFEVIQGIYRIFDARRLYCLRANPTIEGLSGMKRVEQNSKCRIIPTSA